MYCTLYSWLIIQTEHTRYLYNLYKPTVVEYFIVALENMEQGIVIKRNIAQKKECYLKEPFGQIYIAKT
jgi:hypothetical protein